MGVRVPFCGAERTDPEMRLKSETARVGRGLCWVLCCAIFLAASAGFQRIAGAVSQPRALITQAVSDANLVILAGNTRAEANSANDRGAAAADLPLEHMMLQLQRSPEQEQALETYIDQLEDTKSRITIDGSRRRNSARD